MSWVAKAFDITDFGNHGQSKDMFDPFVTGQGLHRFLVARCVGKRLNLLLVRGKNAVQCLQLSQQLFQVHLETTRRGLDGACQPGIVKFRPMGFVLGLRPVVQTIAAQQRLHVLAQIRLLLQ